MIMNWIHPPKLDDDRLDYVARIVHASLLTIAAVGTLMWAVQTVLLPASAVRFAVIYLAVIAIATLALVIIAASR